MKRVLPLFIALAIAIAVPGSASAQEVMAGLDLLETDDLLTTEIDLSNLNALCPGCFVIGPPQIEMKGIALHNDPSCPGNNLGDTDTIVERLQSTTQLVATGNDIIPIQIVALHLQSVQPFQVDCGGGIENWMLDVTVDPGLQPIGQMQIQRLPAQPGGFFDSFLPVVPILTFTRVDPCPPTIACQVVGPQDDFGSSGSPWRYQPSPGGRVIDIPGCTSNFVAGWDPFSEPFTGGKGRAPFSEAAMLAAHGIGPPPPPKIEQHNWQMAVHFEFWIRNNDKQPVDNFRMCFPRWIPSFPPGAPPEPVILKSCSICDTIPDVWPAPPPDRWCQVEWDSTSPDYRQKAIWVFPPIGQDEMAPDMDVVFGLPENPCIPIDPDSGAWFEVDYQCYDGCVEIGNGTFRFHCEPQAGGTGVNEPIPVLIDIGKKGVLDQNYPNPFNPRTTIRFRVAKQGNVNLQIFNLQGELVKTLVSGTRTVGEHEEVWDGTNDQGKPVSSGAYLYQIDVGGVQEAKKMIILK